jgi:hypothetical protein
MILMPRVFARRDPKQFKAGIWQSRLSAARDFGCFMASRWEQKMSRQDSPLLIPSEKIVLLMQGAQMVDLARVVEVMLDHHGDDPARLLQFTPVRH